MAENGKKCRAEEEVQGRGEWKVEEGRERGRDGGREDGKREGTKKRKQKK